MTSIEGNEERLGVKVGLSNLAFLEQDSVFAFRLFLWTALLCWGVFASFNAVCIWRGDFRRQGEKKRGGSAGKMESGLGPVRPVPWVSSWRLWWVTSSLLN